jgi:hypothetical protein
MKNFVCANLASDTCRPQPIITLNPN